MVYNWAHGVAVEVTWETAIELAKIARVVAIKDSTMNRFYLGKSLTQRV